MKHPFRKRTRGAAVVEAAIVSPVLAVLTFGMIEMGWYVNSLHNLHNAARQGARAAVRPENSNAEVEAAVLDALPNSIDPDDVDVRMYKLDDAGNVDYEVQTLDDNESNDPIRVTVTIGYATMGMLSNVIGLAPENLISSAVMQRQP